MKSKWFYWSFLPHTLSSACFIAAFAWISFVETNRSDPDRLLGVAGFLGLAAAVAATVTALVFLRRRGGKWRYFWQAAHVVGLAGAMYLANNWLGSHIA